MPLALYRSRAHTHTNQPEMCALHTLYRCYQLNSITKFYKHFNTFFVPSSVRALYSLLLYVDVITYFFFVFLFRVFWCVSLLKVNEVTVRCNTMCQSVDFFCAVSFVHIFFLLLLVVVPLSSRDSATYTCFTWETEQYHWTFFCTYFCTVVFVKTS